MPEVGGYQNVINALKLHGGALNQTAADWANIGNRLNYTAPQGGPKGVNPWSSEAYVPTTYRDIASGYAPVQDPRDLYSQFNKDLTSWDKTLLKGTKGLAGYQLGEKISPYVQQLGETLGGTALGKGGLNLGPAAAVYGAFGSDQNPYTFTRQEGLGTTAATMMGAHQLSKLLPATSKLAGGTALKVGAGGINPYVMVGSLLLSMFLNKKRKQAAKKAKYKAGMEVQKQQEEQYEERSEKLQNMRDDILAQQTSQMHAADASRYTNQYGGNYSSRFQADEGMKFTPKELKKIAKAGRHGDTMLAHVTPEESALLQALGGSGTINPYTGLPEHWGPFKALKRLVSTIAGGASAAGNVVHNALSPIVNPIFDQAGNIATPVFSNIIAPAVNLGGKSFGSAIRNVSSGLRSGLAGSLGIATDIAEEAADIADPIVRPIMGAAGDVIEPGMEVLHDLSEPVLKGVGEGFTGILEGGLEGVKDLGHEVVLPAAEWAGDFVNDALTGIIDMFTGQPVPMAYGTTQVPGELKRSALKKLTDKNIVAGVQPSAPGLSGLKKSEKDFYTPGDWVSSKENPYIAANVEEEIDYAAKGMKYKGGGKADIVAEFTGNELIVNDQDKVEKGLSSGNYAMAAAPIRRAMKRKQLTPGPETHRGNPMPVDSKGNIYAGGGKLKFKVMKGAGIYDHATDQFKPTMTDKEIAMTAYNNIAKWESNGMA